jgi:hypothetical protein
VEGHAGASKDIILFLKCEIKAGKKLKALPKLKAMTHTPPAHTAFLLRGTTTTTAATKDYTMPRSSQSPYPQSPSLSFVYAEPSNLNMFLTSIQLQQYLPTLISNRFNTMMAMATLNKSLLDALGICTLGHRAVLLSAVAQLRQS